MRIDILTLFPEMFEGFINTSIIKRAKDKGLVTINLVDYRKYSTLNNNQVDDTAFGGGAGMVIMCEPIVLALEDIKTDDSFVVLLDPKGEKYTQSVARKYKDIKHLILICGHYEGIDERIKNFVDATLSIGDFVLTGGEVAAMAISDSIIRLLPGVITDESLDSESFDNNLLDFPVYTKPRVFRGIEVPEVLLSGNHKLIKEYRESEQKRLTESIRPDIVKDKYEWLFS